MSLPERHQATDLKILGIYHKNGSVIDGTASSGSGQRVSVVFRPDSKGIYYIAVGSEGEDRTCTYTISVAKTDLRMHYLKLLAWNTEQPCTSPIPSTQIGLKPPESPRPIRRESQD